MKKKRERSLGVEGCESRLCLSTIGFDHIIAPKPAGNVAPKTTSLAGHLSGAMTGTSSGARGSTTSDFIFTGSLNDPGPVLATMTVTTNKSDHLTKAAISLKNSLGTIHLISHAGDYLGVRQTSANSSFGAIYHVQSGSGGYAHLRGTGTFVLSATPVTATSAQFQLQLTPTTKNSVSLTTY